jgi:hypothetical protein
MQETVGNLCIQGLQFAEAEQEHHLCLKVMKFKGQPSISSVYFHKGGASCDVGAEHWSATP